MSKCSLSLSLSPYCHAMHCCLQLGACQYQPEQQDTVNACRTPCPSALKVSIHANIKCHIVSFLLALSFNGGFSLGHRKKQKKMSLALAPFLCLFLSLSLFSSACFCLNVCVTCRSFPLQTFYTTASEQKEREKKNKLQNVLLL